MYMNKIAVCLIAHYPTEHWLEFLNNFESYDVYMLVDDNSINYQEKYGETYKNITFLQVYNDDYKKDYFFDKDFMIEDSKLSGIYKSLFYFSKILTTYEYVWYTEDDVFIYNENTIKNLDEKYPTADLLSNKFIENTEGKNSSVWHWYRISLEYDPPVYNTMVCISRMSQKMLACIYEYAQKYQTLFWIECMYPTLAVKNNLVYENPPEFFEIHYRKDFALHEYNKTGLFHPVKNFESHPKIREYVFHRDKTEELAKSI